MSLITRITHEQLVRVLADIMNLQLPLKNKLQLAKNKVRQMKGISFQRSKYRGLNFGSDGDYDNKMQPPQKMKILRK